MFNFFKKKNKTTEKNQQLSHVAPGTQIHYIPDLIENLQEDHKELLTIFGQINTAFEAENYRFVTEKLKIFKMKLTDHLLVENIRLYIYLGHEFTQDEATSDLIKSFRSEMNQISKVVMSFLTKYETIGVDKGLAETFGKDLNNIGSALVERINREEHTLYPLYMQNY